MQSKLRVLGLVVAALVASAIPTTVMAAPACDVPLPIVRTVGEAKVLIILDSSGSMNEPMYHDDYDDQVTYSGKFDPADEYYVSSDGNYTPKDFNNNWASSPTAYLVDSDQGADGWYPGNYMNWIYYNATAAQVAAIPRITRLQMAKQVVSGVFASGANTSYGLMKFNKDDGGTLLAPIGTSVATLQSKVNGIEAENYTPLAETMVDALTYFQSTGRRRAVPEVVREGVHHLDHGRSSDERPQCALVPPRLRRRRPGPGHVRQPGRPVPRELRVLGLSG